MCLLGEFEPSLAITMNTVSGNLVVWIIVGLLFGSGPDLVQVGELETPRFAHTTDRIAQDRFLVVGGMATGGRVLGAVILDTSNGVSETSLSMSTPRHSHSSTMLCDGRVLIVGGYDADNRYLAGSEVFDPRQGSFSNAGALRVQRAGHTATRLNDCRVLVIGGVGAGWQFLSSAEIFDPETGTWSDAGNMLSPRESHTATLTPNGDVIVVGGHSGPRRNLQVLDSIERFSPVSGTFEALGQLVLKRHKHDAVLMEQDRLWVIGGSDERDSAGMYSSTEYVDLTTGVSTAGPPLRLNRFKLRGTVVKHPGGEVSILGGAGKAEVFPSGSQKSHLLPTGDLAGQFSTATLNSDHDAIIVGGYSTGMSLSGAVWRFSLPE